MGLYGTVVRIFLALALIVAVDRAVGQEGKRAPAARETVQKKLDEREAQRRVEMAEHQRRKLDFARRCNGRFFKSESDLEYCRAAYRRL